MKKRFLGIAAAAMLAVGMFALAGCASGAGQAAPSEDGASSQAPQGEISVYSREDGSGTRGAFVELMGIQGKDAAGKKVDLTTQSAAITNSTSVMMTAVAGDEQGIGYISLGSLNDTVKALAIDGVEPTAGNIENGSYKVARPFNIVTKDGASETAQDFIAFIMSAEGQKIVEDAGYISLEKAPAAYQPKGTSGKVVLAGSSSVTPVMEKLAEGYEALNPQVSIEVNQSDSTTGVKLALEGTCDIGMASRELKDSELAAGAKPAVIAQDGIAIIVNKANAIGGLSADQVAAIYKGEVVNWSDVA